MTYTEFVSMLAGLTVTGVPRRFNAPPVQLSTAQLPAMWPRLPRGASNVVTLGSALDVAVLTCDLVVAVEAVGQNAQLTNYARALSIIDALQAALTAEAEEGALDSWQFRLDGELIGETPYWVIVATVTGSG
jgi:hypothetical protein